MVEQIAVLAGVARVAAWLEVPRTYLRRVQQVAVPDPRTVDIGADTRRFEPTTQELWQRVVEAPVIGRVGHSLKYAGGAAHPDPSGYIPPWVTRQGVDLSVLQQVQLANLLQEGRMHRDEQARAVPTRRKRRAMA